MPFRSEIISKGYVFLSAHLVADGSTEEIVQIIGEPARLGAGAPVHQLMPLSANVSTPNTYSGMYGHGQFPFHTDLAHWRHPPRFLLLRCITGFNEVPTLLIDGAALIAHVGQNILGRAIVRPRRPVKGSLPLLRLYNREKGCFGMIRWDEEFIKPANKAGEIGSTRIQDFLAQSRPVKVALLQRGDTLIIDNWRMLHGRAPVPENCRSRLLERAYLGMIN